MRGSRRPHTSSRPSVNAEEMREVRSRRGHAVGVGAGEVGGATPDRDAHAGVGGRTRPALRLGHDLDPRGRVGRGEPGDHVGRGVDRGVVHHDQREVRVSLRGQRGERRSDARGLVDATLPCSATVITCRSAGTPARSAKTSTWGSDTWCTPTTAKSVHPRPNRVSVVSRIPVPTARNAALSRAPSMAK